MIAPWPAYVDVVGDVWFSEKRKLETGTNAISCFSSVNRQRLSASPSAMAANSTGNNKQKK